LEFSDVSALVSKVDVSYTMHNNKKTELFYLINSLHKGGAERQLLTISTYLPAKILLLENVIQYDNTSDKDIILLNKSISNTKLAKLFSFISAAYRVLKIIKQSKKNNDVIVISLLERSNIINLLVSFLTRHKAILSIRINLDIQYKNYAFVKWFFRKFYKHAFAVTSNSAGVRNLMINNYAIPSNRAYHIPNAYNRDSIIDLSNKKLNSEKFEQLIQTRSYFLSINRLDSQKNIEFQIALIKELKKEYPEICLIIVGDGPLRANLIRTAETIGLKVFNSWKPTATQDISECDIIFLGYLDNPYRLYKYSMSLLLTSDYESLPNVVIEALICETIVVSTDCFFGPREILTWDTSYISDKVSYGEVECGILLPVIADFEKSLVDWVSYTKKIIDKEIIFSAFEANVKRKVDSYIISSVINKWESLIK